MSIGEGRPENTAGLGDEDLLGLVRSGDTEAYGALYQRHHSVALAVARKNSDNRSDAEDAVSEAFSSVLQALKSGKGPVTFFRAYLLSAVTRISHRRNVAAGKISATEDNAVLDGESSDPDLIIADFESDAVSRAFKSLPERWQAVLWYIDIENMKPAVAAPFLGLSPNGVSALTIRARDGLRKAYLQNHIRTAADDPCAEYSAKLGSYAMNALRRSQRIEVEKHLDDCLRCTAALIHLKDVGAAMRASVLPAVLGFGYATWLQLGVSGTGKAALLFHGGALPVTRGVASVKTAGSTSVGSGMLAAGSTVAVGILAASVMLGGQIMGFWAAPPSSEPTANERVAEPGTQPGDGSPEGSGGAAVLPDRTLQEVSFVAGATPADRPQAEQPVLAGPAPDAVLVRPVVPQPQIKPPVVEPPVVIPPVVTPVEPPVTPPVVEPPVIPPVVEPPVIPPVVEPPVVIPPVVEPPVVIPPAKVSAEVTSSGPHGRQDFKVAFAATGTQPLTSAKVVFRLDPKLGQHFGSSAQQPAGWQCSALDPYQVSCVADSVDRANLAFGGTVIFHLLSGDATLSYEFSAANAESYSGQTILGHDGILSAGGQDLSAEGTAQDELLHPANDAHP